MNIHNQSQYSLDPIKTVERVAEHAASTSELGALAWNTAIESGTLDLSKVQVAPDRWHSQSSGSGRLILGTAAMDSAMRTGLIYGGEHLSYDDEVARRLLHELSHGAFFRARYMPATRELTQLAFDVRNYDAKKGLTPLGSIDYYNTINDRVIEDVTELLTMRIIGRAHIDGYLELLRDSRFGEARDRLGLAGLEDTTVIREAIEKSADEALR